MTYPGITDKEVRRDAAYWLLLWREMVRDNKAKAIAEKSPSLKELYHVTAGITMGKVEGFRKALKLLSQSLNGEDLW